jgi:hypothetical protein
MEMNEFVELYIKDLDPKKIDEIYSAVKDDREALEPDLQVRDDGHSVIMIGFKSPYTRQRFIGKFSGKFPGMIDWR